ncbi:MAG: hypothetical protein ACYSUP_17360 [Planctomycetota bacterium]|jgi:hypothetical protein
MDALTVWMVLVAVTVAVCIVVIIAVRKPLSDLLKANSYISPARNFYVRAFMVLIFLAALATICETDTPETGKAFMEYVWWVVGSLQPMFFALSLWVIAYAALMTLLFMILGRYRD